MTRHQWFSDELDVESSVYSDYEFDPAWEDTSDGEESVVQRKELRATAAELARQTLELELLNQRSAKDLRRMTCLEERLEEREHELEDLHLEIAQKKEVIESQRVQMDRLTRETTDAEERAGGLYVLSEQLMKVSESLQEECDVLQSTVRTSEITITGSANEVAHLNEVLGHAEQMTAAERKRADALEHAVLLKQCEIVEMEKEQRAKEKSTEMQAVAMKNRLADLVHEIPRRVRALEREKEELALEVLRLGGVENDKALLEERLAALSARDSTGSTRAYTSDCMTFDSLSVVSDLPSHAQQDIDSPRTSDCMTSDSLSVVSDLPSHAQQDFDSPRTLDRVTSRDSLSITSDLPLPAEQDSTPEHLAKLTLQTQHTVGSQSASFCMPKCAQGTMTYRHSPDNLRTHAARILHALAARLSTLQGNTGGSARPPFALRKMAAWKALFLRLSTRHGQLCTAVLMMGLLYVLRRRLPRLFCQF